MYPHLHPTYRRSQTVLFEFDQVLDLLLVVLVAQQLTVLRGQLLHLTLNLMVTTGGTQEVWLVTSTDTK